MDFLERDGCLQALERALAAAVSGGGGIALVSGEAGIGKTRLVERFFRQPRPSVRQLWGACDAFFTPRPLGPLHDMVDALPAALASLVTGQADQASLFAAILAELQATPTLLVCEDVHWADAATLDLLRFLARRIGRTRALLVLTYRDDELGPEHPWRLVLGDLAAGTPVTRLALPPLSAAAVRRLVGSRAIDAGELHQRTGGNPFFVTEVLAGSEQSVPLTIRDAVLARVARLSPSGQAVIQAAAVIAPRIESWLLTAITGAEALAAAECMSRGLLVAQGELLSFRHDLSRQTVLEVIAPPHRVALHGMVLAALRASPVAERDPARLAHHAAGANDGAAVLSYALPAARQRSAASAHREAAALYALALPFADELPLAERAGLVEAHAWECHVSGDVAGASAGRRQAEALWRQAGNRLKQGENLGYLAIILTSIEGCAAAERVCREAIALLESVPPGRELALAYRTLGLIYQSDHRHREAIRLAEQAAALAARCDDRRVLAMAYDTLGAAWMFLDPACGREYFDRCLTTAQAAGLAPRVANVYGNLGSIACHRYRFAEAEQALTTGLTYAAERDLDLARPFILAWRAVATLHLGQWATAEAAATEVASRPSSPLDDRATALLALGRLAARRGDANANAVTAEAVALAQRSGDFHRVGPALAAAAEASWLAGDQASTIAQAQTGLALALSREHPWLVGEFAYWCWRADVAVTLPPWTAAPFADQIAGDWAAAATAWRALGCPYETARALAEGDAAAQAEALELFEQLGARPAAAELRRRLRGQGVSGLPRGPRATTRANPLGLTARQEEILALLADGLSNVEIATRLSIALKTVDHHVSAVLAKLDVRSREEAAALVRRMERRPSK